MGHDSAKKAQEKQGTDITELMAAVAMLNNDAPPSNPVIVPNSVFPVSEAIKKKAAAEKAENPEPGQRMPDGTFYLGRFTGADGIEKDWFAAAKDAAGKMGKKLLLDFNEAAQYAKDSKAHKHNDWMAPCYDTDGQPNIIKTIFNLREKISGFDQTDSWQHSAYWTSVSTYGGDFGERMDFSDGILKGTCSGMKLSVRLVRSAPSPAQARKDAAEEAARIETGIPKLGETMADGTIYAGISPTTHQLMFAEPAGTLTKNFNKAAEYATNLQVGDKHDFLVPDREELQVLFDNRNVRDLKGTFTEAGAGGDDWYRSSRISTHNPGDAWSQCFSDGHQSLYPMDNLSALRCIRYGKVVKSYGT